MINHWEIMLTPERQQFHTNAPLWEHERLEAMHEVIQPGMTIYDIGAEEGDMSALYQLWAGAEGKTVLVEPSPWYWPRIKQTYELNNLPAPVAMFCGFAGPETTGEIETVWPRQVHKKYPIYEGFTHLSERPDVPIVALDDLAAIAVPDVIMIDVEGAEWEVLKGAVEILRTHKPHVFCSVHPSFMFANYQQEEGELYRFLSDLEYDKRHLAYDHEHQWHFFPG